jgi:hypothetical protein
MPGQTGTVTLNDKCLHTDAMSSRAHAMCRTETLPTICMSRNIDSAATVDKNGKLSNARLHEQMTEGVDDTEFRMKTKAKMRARGIPEEDLDRLFK